ncbi:MAG: Piwi domain-containing protein, partial [Rhabdochlamydiaceae bacterium]
DTIVQAKEGDNLRKGIANPLFLQIAAKCAGQPYGLQPGFVRPGTIFVGLDKYRQPFKRNTPTVISVTFFDSDGAYLCGDSDIIPYEELNGESKLEQLLKESYDKYKQLKGVDATTILYFIDTGVGTMDVELGKYIERCAGLAKKIGAEFIFACGNKGSHLRLYSGDPLDLALTAERVSAFSAATRMPVENQVLVVSTEPIISRQKAKEYGTPRAVLYTIIARSEGIGVEEAKRTVAKSVIWLCRHAWISPASTREPAPIFFANKLSRLVAATGVRITPDRTTAPLFL